MDTEVRSAAEQITNALSAIENSEYASAASAYGQAAQKLETTIVNLYTSQACAFISAEQYDSARVAAENGIRLAPQSGKSWYWKATALLKLGCASDAKKAFNKAARFESDLSLKTSYMDWATKCDEVDEVETIDATNGTSSAAAKEVSAANGVEEGCARASVPVATAMETEKARRATDNTKMQWYQSPTFVNIDIYAKNVIKEESSVSFDKSSVKVNLTRADMEKYVLEKELSENIVAEESSWSMSKFKVEIRLKKANRGSTWKNLDKDAEVVSAAVEAGNISMRRKAALDAQKKGWDSFAESELKDYKEDDSSMAVFRSLYEGADDDARRAMMKSYSESGGQVLSTNWEDVKKKKVTYEEPEEKRK